MAPPPARKVLVRGERDVHRGTQRSAREVMHRDAVTAAITSTRMRHGVRGSSCAGNGFVVAIPLVLEIARTFSRGVELERTAGRDRNIRWRRNHEMWILRARNAERD